jgi:hypothetical protein
LRTFFAQHERSALRLADRVPVGSVRREPADPVTLNVCATGCPFNQLAPAAAAATDGDTIRIGPGTYAGGVTVDASVAIVGSGPGSTIISGGGPVLTIGAVLAASEPTVSLSSLTIEDGVTVATPLSVAAVGAQGAYVGGGGIEIPPNAGLTGGADVTISNSVITSNMVDSTAAVDSGFPCPADITITCINGDIPFSQATGGGIDNWGTLTLSNSQVTNNKVGVPTGLANVTTDAYGGGIQSWLGPVAISNTVISGNDVGASTPNGFNVNGGGVLVGFFGGTLSMSNSSVTDNTETLKSSFPDDVQRFTGATGGGIEIGDGTPSATVSTTTVTDNSISMTNSVGSTSATSGGLQVNSLSTSFTVTNSVIDDNSAYSATLPSSTGTAAATSGAGQIDGSVSNTRMSGNTVTAVSAAGVAEASGGAIWGYHGQMSNTLVSQNEIRAMSPQGVGEAGGGGLDIGFGAGTLLNTLVSGNTVTVNGQGELAVGGGLLDADAASPGAPLALVNSRVTGNALLGDPGASLVGGGLFIQGYPVTMTHSLISGNSPDQCFGC